MDLSISSRQSVDKQRREKIRQVGHRMDSEKDLDPLIDSIGDAKYVLLGEASHGTHEYYTWRSKISKRLIQEKGFSFIAVEGDWPDCYRLNRFIKGFSDGEDNVFDVLHEFNRWPTWMWANWEILELSNWLKSYNEGKTVQEKVGFYGLDVYSLGESLEAILEYLQKRDLHTYEVAKAAANCFEPYSYEGQDYAEATRLVPDSCEPEVVKLLADIRSNIARYNTDPETVFSTEQNALITLHAEAYYRAIIKGGPGSWNIRDRHMVETLDRLMELHGSTAKAIVWAHNTHIGDARATDMHRHGMVNIGGLLSQEKASAGVVKVGFGSYAGKVIAGSNWGDAMRRMNVPEGKKGSWEFLNHEAGAEDRLLLMDTLKDDPLFEDRISHRAIGVIYDPYWEFKRNYVPSILPARYDAFIHIDKTHALHPLHIQPDGHQIPETYPWGM